MGSGAGGVRTVHRPLSLFCLDLYPDSHVGFPGSDVSLTPQQFSLIRFGLTFLKNIVIFLFFYPKLRILGMSLMSLKLSPGSLAWHSGSFIICPSLSFQHEFSTSLFHDWRRQWRPTLVLLPGKSHGWRNLVGCRPWGHYVSDTTEWLRFHFSLSCIGEGHGNPL